MNYLIFFLTIFTSWVGASTRAIVFDFGGVMTGNPNREQVVDFLEKSLNLNDSEFKEANFQKKQAIANGSTDEEFWIEYAKTKHIQLPADWIDQFRECLKKALGINTEMYSLVSELKEKNIKLAMLPNIDTRLSAMIRKLGLYEPFQPCLLSCEIGMEKPDPKIYAHLLKELDLPSSDIVFIDDRLENIEAAKKAGIDAVLFKSSLQIREELIKRNVGLEISKLD